LARRYANTLTFMIAGCMLSLIANGRIVFQEVYLAMIVGALLDILDAVSKK
jgi:hypothetical protein